VSGDGFAWLYKLLIDVISLRRADAALRAGLRLQRPAQPYQCRRGPP